MPSSPAPPPRARRSAPCRPAPPRCRARWPAPRAAPPPRAAAAGRGQGKGGAGEKTRACTLWRMRRVACCADRPAALRIRRATSPGTAARLQRRVAGQQALHVPRLVVQLAWRRCGREGGAAVMPNGGAGQEAGASRCPQPTHPPIYPPAVHPFPPPHRSARPPAISSFSASVCLVVASSRWSVRAAISSRACGGGGESGRGRGEPTGRAGRGHWRVEHGGSRTCCSCWCSCQCCRASPTRGTARPPARARHTPAAPPLRCRASTAPGPRRACAPGPAALYERWDKHAR